VQEPGGVIERFRTWSWRQNKKWPGRLGRDAPGLLRKIAQIERAGAALSNGFLVERDRRAEDNRRTSSGAPAIQGRKNCPEVNRQK
jgi:hypothetical protein